MSLPERELQGRFESLDRAGRLLLRHPDGTLEAITAGDIFPVASPGAGAAGPKVAPPADAEPAPGKRPLAAARPLPAREGRD